MLTLPASALLSALPVCVIVLDGDDTIIDINPAAEEWLGTGMRLAKGKPLMHFVEDAHVATLLARVRQHQQNISEYDYVLRQETVNLHCAPLNTEENIVLVVARRRTASAHRTQDAIEEKLRTYGLMSAMLAHEVKNPLSGIRGAAQLLLEDALPEQHKLLSLIRDETDRIANVLTQLEPFSEHEPLTLLPVDVHEVLRYVIRLAEAGVAGGIAFQEEYDPTLLHVLAARGQLVQLLFNLVKNAAEALHGRPNGCIRITTSTRQDFEALGREGRIHAQAHVMVQDNGPGIPEALRPHLFEPFVSGRAERGRGLGLTIATKLAHGMGGRLVLENSEPGNTCFRLTLQTA